MKQTINYLESSLSALTRTLRKPKVHLSMAAFATAAIPAILPVEAQGAKPNVVLILADDQGMGDWSWFGEHPYLAGKTPNMEQLVQDGVFLTDFHAMPLCGPSRACLQSGRHSNYVRAWQGRHFMRTDVPTIADMFKAKGYRTALYGKWHLGHGYPYGPESRGYDDNIVLGGGMFGTIEDNLNNDMYTLQNLTLRHNGNFEYFPGSSVDIWFDHAETFMEDSVQQNKPFFVFVSPEAPHAPHISHYHAHDFDSVDFKNADGSDYTDDNKARGFYGQIMDLDDKLGEMRQKIVDLGIEDDTILLYMSDNGTSVADKIYNGSATYYSDQALNLRGHKADSFEGGNREPCWIYWKGHIDGGKKNNSPSHMIDIIPTLYSLCGLTVSPFDAGYLEGQDLSPILLNSGSGALPTDDYYLFSSWATTFDPPVSRGGSIIWKSYRLFGNGLMYDLTNDVHQDNPLSTPVGSTERAIKDAMYAQLDAKIDMWKADVFPFKDPFIIGSAFNPVNDITDNTGGKMDYMYWTGSKYASFWPNIANLSDKFGNYWIQPETPGNYKFHFYRWFYTEQKKINDNNPAGTPVITQLHLFIQELGIEKVVPVSANDIFAELDLNLPQSTMTFDAKFEDASGTPVCSAFFISAQKMPNPPNLPPIAGNDSYQTPMGKTLNVPAPGVLVNDSDAENANISVAIVSQPANGSVTLNADGSFSYSPTATFTGNDSFTYKVNDGTQDSNTAEVTIKVFATSVNTPLAAYWKFDETTGGTAADDTGAHNGTIKNISNANKGIPAVKGTGFKFDNSQDSNNNHILISTPVDIQASDFSYTAWVKPYSYS
jgi:arylsulfatase A-like enzyme